MSEQLKGYFLGRAKIVLGRLGSADEWEVLSLRIFSDDFDYDQRKHMESYASEVLNDTYLMGEDYHEALKDLAKEDLQVFELIAEVHGESWQNWTDCGYEYDCREWLEKVKVREIKGDDLEWFKEEDPERWKGFWGEEVQDAGNG